VAPVLRSLAIRDFVIVDRLELVFDTGFSVLTGETGAGKSILLDSLGLALGARADAGLVRAGAEQAVVTACLSPPADHPALALLREQGLIETRRGRHGGNFVSAVQEPSEQRLTRDLLKTNIDGLRDRRDFYTAIGGKAAELAASRARGHVLDRLQEAAAAVAEAPDSPSAVRLDSRFHLELAASTRSVMLTKAELAAQNDVTPLLWIPGSECLEAASCAREHMAIVEAVAAGDPLLARRQAENHLADSLNQLIELRMRLQQQAATEPRRRGSRTSEGQR